MWSLRRWLGLATCAGAFVVLTASLTVSFQVQRDAAVKAAGRTETVVAALTAMLDQETGLRGFLDNGQKVFLQPYMSGRADYNRAQHEVDQASAGDRISVRLASEENAVALTWQGFAGRSIATRLRGTMSGSTQLQQALYGKSLMDRFRAINAALVTRFGQRRDATLVAISRVSTAALVLLASVFALVGPTWARRRANQLSQARDQAKEATQRGNELQHLIVEREQRDLLVKAQLASIVESSEDSITARSLDGTVLSWNAGAERLTGYNATEMIGTNLSLMTDPGQFDHLPDFFLRVGGGERFIHFETRRAHKNGRPIDCSVTLSPIRDPSGTVTGVSAISRDITERKRTEELAAQLVAIVESSEDAIFGKDLTGVVTSWNAGAERLYGYSAQEMIGENISLAVPPDRPDELPGLLHRVGNGERIAPFETRRRRKDGNEVDVAITLSPVRGAAGTVTGVSTVARDITERKQSEAAAAQLAAIVESSDDAIVGWSLAKVITSWNRGAERIYGYRGDEVIGSDGSLLVPADRLGRLMNDLLARAARGEKVPSYEAKGVRRDRTEIDVSVTLSSVRDPSGKVTGVSAIARDITERKKVETAAASLAAIVESSDDAIVGWSLANAITSWNKGAERLLGYRSDEMLGRGNAALLAVMVPTERPEGLLQAPPLATEGATRFEVKRAHKDGHIVELSATASPVYDAQGVLIGTSIVARDVTERKRDEERLAFQSDELRRSNAELAQFAYIASHDLSEPLRTISGYVELIARRYQGQIDADADRFIKHTVEGCHRLRALIEDLLSYSRAGRSDEAMTSVDCDIVVHDVLASLGATLSAAGAQVDHAGLPTVHGDPAQLAHLFQNLIANSLKFTRPGIAPHIRVAAEREGDRWAFSVQDNGIGIEAEYRERIFVMFQRLHNREAYPGTGIGLAICTRIVEAHGGRIWAEQSPGPGSRFCFTLAATAGVPELAPPLPR
ncbi:MAG: PAS domain S-box protein [Acidimicrobiales bacterium]|jgi:PAS domain S-box-containing protein